MTIVVSMSLHKDAKGRSPYWYCCYRMGDGRRTMRSTGETDRSRAKIKCDALERMAEESARSDVDRMWLDRIAEETMRRLGHVNCKTTTVADFLAKWLESVRGTVSPRTFEKYAQVIRDCCSGLGSLALQAVRDEHIVR